MSTLIKNNLINKRLASILLLGFSSGLPLALVGSTLQAWFTNAHTSLATIGFLSLLGIPYTLKFLWAPLMDHYSILGFNKRKGWIFITQLGLIFLLLLLATFNPTKNAIQMGWIAFLIAFFSASQDIAIDAYRTDILIEDERGLGASYYIFTYRLATLVAGGVALILADIIGWRMTYDVMALLMVLVLLLAFFVPPPQEMTLTSHHLFATIKMAFKNLFQRDKVLLILLFIIFYKFGDALALSLMTTFLLDALHFSLTELGVAYKTVSMVATVLGAFIGGVLLTRWTIYRALLIFGALQALSNLLFVVLALVGKHFMLMAAVIFVENFCSGLSTAALLALMMSLCDRRFSASQFALLSAFASLSRVVLGPIASGLVLSVGWVEFFFISFLLCFPSLLFLILIKNEVFSNVFAPAD